LRNLPEVMETGESQKSMKNVEQSLVKENNVEENLTVKSLWKPINATDITITVCNP